MAEVKRWSVTYTKHMKQKRKVYQDGFLELHTSTNKLKLYDDCEKLLECRILKTDEAVSSGQTLTFNSFLVDVNDAESGDGDQKPKQAGFSSLENDMPFSEKRAKSWNKLPPFQTPAQNIIRERKPLQNLSPSQNIIKEFKKREQHKYGAALSSPETVKTSTTEWQALYTTQLTQKAKKYHDGFLQLSITGTHGKQIILLDSDRNQLNSRFIKKDEVIESGGSIAFDAHLVDIGEQEDKPTTDLHHIENKQNVVGEARIKQESNGVITGKDEGKEWEALYTTQITQKSKRYHVGILRLASSGSLRKKVTLLDEDKSILSNKYVNLSEDIKTGSTLELPKYLVEVCAPRAIAGGEATILNKACMKKPSHSKFSISSLEETKSNRVICRKNPLFDNEENSLTKACVKKALNLRSSVSSAEETNASRGAPSNKPIRDSHQILSFLRNPMAHENVASRQSNSTARQVSSMNGSQVLDTIMLDITEDVRSVQSYSSEPHLGSVENKEADNIMEIGCKAISSDCSRQLAEEMDIKNSHQIDSDHVKAVTTQLGGECASDESRSSSCISHDADDYEKIIPQELCCARELELPSFDLGF